jgi:hypothetical protein
MDTYWLEEFRSRMDRFAAGRGGDGQAFLIKVRVCGGCFCRNCCPNAHEIIDRHRRAGALRDAEVVEHETGPEVLFWMTIAAAATAGIQLTASVIELITKIIEARTEGRKRGDRRDESLELIVRTIDKDGKFIEVRAGRYESGKKPSPTAIRRAISAATKKLPRPVLPDRPQNRKNRPTETTPKAN